jgi:putative ATP-binding cassette transporter
MNAWNKPFYDALSRRDLHDFITPAGRVFHHRLRPAVLNVAQKWLARC